MNVFVPLSGVVAVKAPQLAGKWATVTIKPKGVQRSQESNRRYWALLTVAARELGYDDVEELHEGVAAKFLALPEKVEGVPRRRRTPKLTTSEFSDYMTACERFFRMDLNLDLSGWDLEMEHSA